VNARDLEIALSITPLFYRAAIEPAEWEGVLARLAAVFGGQSGQVFLMDQETGAVLASAQSGLPPEKVRRWLGVENLLEVDPRARRALARPNMPASERTLMPEEEWLASRFYREVSVPNGFDSTVGAYVVLEAERLVACIAVIRALGDPPFARDDIDRMHLYLPHFREAMRMAGRLQHAEERIRGLAALFNTLRAAAILTDRFGRVAWCNAAARSLLADGGPLEVHGGRLAARRSPARERLASAIFAAATCATGTGEGERMVAVPDDAGAGLFVSVAPLPRQPATFFGPTMQAILFVLDPRRRYESDGEMLQRLFGLTAAEARVMAMVGDGVRPAEIAARTGRSLATVRSQLKAVFAKTGTATQAELSRLVGRLRPP
jgi:DNA-binding CsgD family transcriptional regulator/PAS domain-containing protein